MEDVKQIEGEVVFTTANKYWWMKEKEQH